MAVDIEQMAEEEGTREIFLGYGERNTYLAFGRHWGPGKVTVPNSIADTLAEAVRRVNRGRKADEQVNPEGPPPPRSVRLNEASTEELMEAIRLRGINLPGEPIGPLGESKPEASMDTTGLQGGEATNPNPLSGLDAAAQAAADAAAKVAAQAPPPPPIKLAPGPPAEGTGV